MSFQPSSNAHQFYPKQGYPNQTSDAESLYNTGNNTTGNDESEHVHI